MLNLTVKSLTLVSYHTNFLACSKLSQKQRVKISNVKTNRFTNSFMQIHAENSNQITRSSFKKYLSSVISLNSQEWKNQIIPKTIDTFKLEDLTFVECTFMDIKSKGCGIIGKNVRSNMKITFTSCKLENIDSDDSGMFSGECGGVYITKCQMDCVYSLNMYPLFSAKISNFNENKFCSNDVTNIGNDINKCHNFLFDFVANSQAVYENNITYITSGDNRCGGSHWAQLYNLKYNTYAYCSSSTLLSILPSGELESYIFCGCNLRTALIESGGKITIKNSVFARTSKALNFKKETDGSYPIYALIENCYFDEPVTNYNYPKDYVDIKNCKEFQLSDYISFPVQDGKNYGFKLDYVPEKGSNKASDEKKKSGSHERNAIKKNGKNKANNSVLVGALLGFGLCAVIAVIFWFAVILPKRDYGKAISFRKPVKSVKTKDRAEKLAAHPEFERTPSFDSIGIETNSESYDYDTDSYSYSSN